MGGFEVLEITGSGAMGTVCVVRRRDAAPGAFLAVKVLKEEHVGNASIVERTRDEARLMYRLRHPHIVVVHELIEVARRPVLVMEWVQGVSYRTLLDRVGAVDWWVVAHTGRATADALDQAYGLPPEAGTAPLRVVHRDLKPGNLLLSVDGVVKVVDFGVARGVFGDREHSTQATIIGSKGYMAPERFDGKGDDPSSDVYALGITMIELLTGAPVTFPRHPDAHDTVLERITGKQGLPEGFREILVRMCRYDPAQRASHREVKEALDEVLAAHREGGGPPDLAGYAEKWVRPLFETRKREDPKRHSDWPKLAFLESDLDQLGQKIAGDGVPTRIVPGETAADRRLRRVLQSPGWEADTKALLWVLASNPEWTEAPFVELLRAFQRPWWRFWQRRPTSAQVVTSLQMLKHRRSPWVLDLARELASHPDASVAQGARTLLEVEVPKGR